jgi:calcineurin-like phosphoesterase family protein
LTANNKMRGLISAIVFAVFLLLFVQPQAVAADWRFTGVERVVAVSDVHGAYDAMIMTLTKAGVLDEEQGWGGGATHLVITGDILDRGADSRKVMDLLMSIEGEALDAGGRVHLLLGNHEVMNLVGDLRYVSKAEYAAFADDESEEERERWFDVYRRERSKGARIDMLRHEYTRKNPPGFFGLRRAFSSRGKYGQWLLTKPLMVVINGVAFVHGGLPPLVAELGLDGVNGELKSQVSDYVVQVDLLVDEGMLDPTENFYKHGDLLKDLSKEKRRRTPEVNAAIRTVIKLNKGSVHGANSPLWYRGTVGCGPLIEEEKLAASLEALEADRVVIGHTPTLTRRVLERMNGRVIEIDTGMLKATYKGGGNALVIEGDSMYVVAETSSETYEPVPHPRRVGFRTETLDAKQLTQVLVNGDITPTSTPESGKTTVNVTYFGESIAAVFEETARGKDVYPELAAYRLDVMLGLGMVPVTVAREMGGRKGSLQFIPGSMIDDVDRSAKSRGGSAWCPLGDQWQAMYIFDALTYNEGRSRRNMMYSIDNWQLILTEHKQTFSTRRGFPKHVANMEAQTGEKLKIGDGWDIALTELTDDYLNEELGDVLDKNRIGALARRRNDLLKH